MGKEREPRQRRASTHFKFYSEKYLWGSTKAELRPDERAVWLDFLCLGSINFGVIKVYSRHHLAKQLLISRKLLDRSIEKFLKFKKIEKKCEVGAQCDTSEENGENFIIIKWEHFQDRFLTKHIEKPTKSGENLRLAKEVFNESKNCPTLHDITEDNTIEDNITQNNTTLQESKEEEDFIDGKDIPIEKHPPSKSNNFTYGKKSIPNNNENRKQEIPVEGLKQEYLARLGACPNYPLSDYNDGATFLQAWEEFPGIDILAELDKKITWWKENPGYLENTANPRMKLLEWFEKKWNMKNQDREKGINVE